VDLGILISGRGSNLGAILRAVRARRRAARIRIVVSDLFRRALPGRVVNFHPALPQAFPGLRAQRPVHSLALERLARRVLRIERRGVIGGLP
jgi:folate-dependent phosphoribosylglycinamide formyltransferase PurN